MSHCRVGPLAVPAHTIRALSPGLALLLCCVHLLVPCLGARCSRDCSRRQAAMLSITWDEALVPEGGSRVFAGVCGLLKSEGKDAAGRAFHEKSLYQAGLLGMVSELHEGQLQPCILLAVRRESVQVQNIRRACLRALTTMLLRMRTPATMMTLHAMTTRRLRGAPPSSAAWRQQQRHSIHHASHMDASCLEHGAVQCIAAASSVSLGRQGVSPPV